MKRSANAPKDSQRASRNDVHPVSSRRDTVINVRLSTSMREMIDRAADALGKSRSEFIIESARAQAIDVLLDQRLFPLGTAQYSAFLKALDAPPAPSERLRQLMASKAPWKA